MPPQSEAIEIPDEAEDETEEREPGWAPSRAVLLITDDPDYVLHYEGTDITHMISDVGRDASDLGFRTEPGIYVWEGVFGYDADGDSAPEGKYRPLTPQEMAYVVRGMSPWGDLDCAPDHDKVERHPLDPLPALEGVGHPLELQPETLAALSTTVIQSREGQNREARPFTLEHARACLSGFWSQPSSPAEYLKLAGVLLQAYEFQMKKK